MIVLGAILFCLVGIVVGLLGGGGSILSVPVLVYLLHLSPKPAIATSLVILCLLSAAAVGVHARAGRVRWKTGAIFGAASMTTAYGLGTLAQYIRGSLLLTLFSLLMVVTAIAMLRRSRPGQPSEKNTSYIKVILVAMGVGCLTGLVGAGGGFLVVPALVLFSSLSMGEAIGTSLMVIVMNSFSGAAGQLMHVSIHWETTILFSATAVVGSLGGARLASHVPQPVLRKGFGWLVLLVGVSMLLSQVLKTTS